jgi:hypothetical protein
MVTWMATRQSSRQEAEEAVIISGARKGELIRLSEDEPELTPGAAALLDELTRDAQRMAESARAAVAEAEALLQDLRQARAK